MRDERQRPALYQQFVRETPAWFRDAKFGVFIHWGAYSVPAWAEPIGELGTIEARTWFAHNPYAEWYANTSRIEGSPAQAHQREVWGGAPYDDFLDAWRAEAFDPADWLDLFARAGARYVIPVTKHHDGITLWDAPGTDGRNTVARGPQRDLVGAIAEATRAAGLRFGVYYSTGLDWHVTDFAPLVDHDFDPQRPRDLDYARYVNAHVRDLVARYSPEVLWGDIEYPDAGKPDGPDSLAHVLAEFYAAVPEGVVNDRWGDTHWDFRTSEYQQGRALEKSTEAWENCRGVGYSFGYNQVEDASAYLDGPAAVRHLVDVVARGGNFLLNVGPDATGRIPALQRACLEGVGDWMAVHGGAVHGSRVLDPAVGRSADAPWVRWTSSADGGAAHAVVDARGPVLLAADADRLDLASARLLDGTPVRASGEDGGVRVDVPDGPVPGPVVVALDVRAG